MKISPAYRCECGEAFISRPSGTFRISMDCPKCGTAFATHYENGTLVKTPITNTLTRKTPA